PSFCAVQNCPTNLLFPFITNQTGFDTGIPTGANSAPQASPPTPQSVGNSFTPSATQTQSFTLPAPDGSLTITINPVNNRPGPGDKEIVPGSYYTYTRTFTDLDGTVASTVTRTGTLPTYSGVTGTQDALKGVLYIGLSLPNPNPSPVVLPQFNSATQSFNALHPFTSPNTLNLSTLPYLQQVPLPGGLHLIPHASVLNSAEIYDETYNTITPLTHVLDTPSTASELAARFAHIPTRLSTGQLVIISGYDSTAAAHASIEEITPTLSTSSLPPWWPMLTNYNISPQSYVGSLLSPGPSL